MSVTSKLGWTVGLVAVVLFAAKDATPGAAVTAEAGGPVADIPAAYLAAYRVAASACPALDWSLLAGIGKIETNHGRSALPGVSSGSNSAGAEGPMQFLPSSFAAVRRRHPEVGPDIYARGDAIPAAAHYLCDSGLDEGDTYRAVYAYNHAGWYVAQVRAQAAAYRAAA